MSNGKNYYDILGISKDATAEQIKKAYKKMAIKYHPDRNPDNKEAEEKFKEVAEANEILSDEEKRKYYDMFGTMEGYGQGGPSGGAGMSGWAEDIINIMGGAFGGFGGFSQREQIIPGRSVRTKIHLDIKDIYCGGKKTIKYKKNVRCSTCHGSGGDSKKCPHCDGSGKIYEVHRTAHGMIRNMIDCPHCHGTGKMVTKKCPTCGGTGFRQIESSISVDFPSGLTEGLQIPYESYGDEARKQGHPNGDLYVLAVWDYDINKYNITKNANGGYNITQYVDVPFYDARLGCELKVVMPNDKEITLTLKPGCPSDKKFKMTGKGIPAAEERSGICGDYYFAIRFTYPDELSDVEKKAMEKLKKELSKKSDK